LNESLDRKELEPLLLLLLTNPNYLLTLPLSAL